MFRRVRRQLNDLWQKSLRQSYAQVNLPSIFKTYAGRVVESMAAGRPVISWRPPYERTQKLFVPGKEILWFEKDNPDELASKIKWLMENPEQANVIATNAKEKVLKYHTAEIRVSQILDWIESGATPDYGETDHDHVDAYSIERLDDIPDEFSRVVESARRGQVDRWVPFNPMGVGSLASLAKLQKFAEKSCKEKAFGETPKNSRACW
ncbi:MAG TPA: glycosyltransferase family 1 protein [Dehalococcoidia bacterium]|nr:glycosyltransferase family 1 protein [Dehalococcoidia bacterium]